MTRQLVLGILLLAAPAFADGVSGTWQGSNFSYALFLGPKTEGHWRDQDTSLIERNRSSLSGTVANQPVSVSIYQGPVLQGKLPCGEFKLWIDRISIVQGTVCGGDVTYNAQSRADATLFMKQTVLDQLFGPLPPPARQFFYQTWWPEINKWQF